MSNTEHVVVDNKGKPVYHCDTLAQAVLWLDKHPDGKRYTIELMDKPSEPKMTPEQADKVNNPSHYTQGSIECIDAMEAMLSRDEFIGYLRGNIFKYQWRYKDKNGLEDLKKANWYSAKLLELEELDSKHKP